MIMKKAMIVGIILLLIGVMIIVSTFGATGATEEKSSSYVTESNGVSVWIINPGLPGSQQSKAPNVQEIMGYITGAGAMLIGGWMLLNSKQKDLLKTDKT